MRNKFSFPLLNSLPSVIATLTALCFVAGQICGAAQLPIVPGVELQPLSAQVKRLIEAMDLVGSPLSDESRKALEAAMSQANAADATEKIQTILDPLCLFGVQINPEMRVKVARGEAKPELVEQGWRQFLVKVHNESGTTADIQTF